MPISSKDYLLQNPDLALLVEELNETDPEKIETLIRWHGIRKEHLAVCQQLDRLIDRAKNHPIVTAQKRIIIRLGVDDMIADCIARYPDQRRCRGDVLDDIFLTIGGGFEWSRGEIICHRYVREDGTEEEPYVICIEAARIIAQDRRPLVRAYPWTDCCNLARMPKNATKPWREAAEEFRQMLVTFGYDFTERDPGTWVEAHKPKKLSVEEISFDEFEELGDDPNE